MAFYRQDPDTGGLMRAPNRVFAPTVTLRAAIQADRERTDEPEGWRWFDTAAEAITHFGIQTWTQYRNQRYIELAQEKIAEDGIDLRQEYRDMLLQGDTTD